MSCAAYDLMSAWSVQAKMFKDMCTLTVLLKAGAEFD